MTELIRENVAAVRAEIGRAAEKAKKENVRLIAAVKYADAEELTALLEAGIDEVGENRVQQLLDREAIYAKYRPRVHFIGTLQTNKVKYIADKVDMIHSVDSLRLAAEIERRAAEHDRVIDVLVEINGARESSKTGVFPEDAPALCRAILQMSHLRLCGFMTMGPRFESDAAYTAYFAGVRQCGEEIFSALGIKEKPLFSMGMSESFTAAVAAGADMVRVGRRLFQSETN